jgi:hypothetical protein
MICNLIRQLQRKEDEIKRLNEIIDKKDKIIKTLESQLPVSFQTTHDRCLKNSSERTKKIWDLYYSTEDGNYLTGSEFYTPNSYKTIADRNYFHEE